MSGRLPALKPADVIAVLERNGFWRIVGRKRHLIFTDGTRIVPVPFHRRDLPRGTLRSIIRLAGWTEEEFVRML